MFFVRFLPILASILVSASFCYWGVSLAPTESGTGYASLVFDEAVSDREVRERLENNGFTGLVSESGQWVLLDSFGGVERVALDEYEMRVLPFDPRNDGYAEKLRSLFVRDGKRYVYMPLGSEAPKIRKELAFALDDIHYSFDLAAASRPALFYFALFCLAAVVLLVARPLRLALGSDPLILIPLLPPLAPLVLGGAAGFALASLLAGCAALLVGPGLQWFAFQRQRGAPVLCRILPPLFLIAYVTLAFFSALPLVFTLTILVFFCGVLTFVLQEAYRAATGNADQSWGALLFKRFLPQRRRFSPVGILRRRPFLFSFSWIMIPFAAIGFVLAGIEYIEPVSGNEPSFLPPSAALIETDYRAHYRFQSTFSFKSLHDPAGHGIMSVFEMNGGLPVHNGAMETDGSLTDIPPFPLADLVQYLNTERQNENIIPLMCSILIPLFFILQGIVIPLFLRKTPHLF